MTDDQSTNPPPKKHRRRLTPEERVKARRDYVDGKRSAIDIAADLGVWPSTVRNAVRREGGTIRTHGEAKRLSEKPRRGRKLSDGQRTEIVRQYRDGVNGPALARRFGVTATTICRVRQEQDVEARSHAIHPATAAKVIALYDDGELTLKQIAGATGVSLASVGNVIRRRGDRRRGKRRTYTLNERRFEDIDEPATARWLGYLAADGCITDDGGAIASCEIGDVKHLEALRDWLGSNAPIRDVLVEENISEKPSHHAVLAVWSRRLTDDLIRHGVTPRKSFTLRPFDGADFLEPFWLAGLVDGDGFVSRAASGLWIVGLTGSSLPVHERFADFVEQHTGRRPLIRPDDALCYHTHVHAIRRCQVLARLFYDDLQGSTPLARKYELAQEMLKVVPKPEGYDWSAFTVADFEELYATCGSWRAVAEQLSVKVSQVQQAYIYRRNKAQDKYRKKA